MNAVVAVGYAKISSWLWLRLERILRIVHLMISHRQLCQSGHLQYTGTQILIKKPSPFPARLLFLNIYRPIGSTAEGTVSVTICLKLLILCTYCDKSWWFRPYLRPSAISLHLWELGSFSYSCALTYCVIKIAASFGKHTTVSVPEKRSLPSLSWLLFHSSSFSRLPDSEFHCCLSIVGTLVFMMSYFHMLITAEFVVLLGNKLCLVCGNVSSA